MQRRPFRQPAVLRVGLAGAGEARPPDYISVEINFKRGPGGALICDFIKEFMEFVEAVFTPELLPEEQVADNEIRKFFSLWL